MKIIIFTQKNRLKLNKEEHRIVKLLAYHSARLYNVGLHSVRQYYFLKGKYSDKIRPLKYKKENELMTISIQGRSARSELP